MEMYRNNKIYQDLKVVQELIRENQYYTMNEKGFNLWWELTIPKICKALSNKLLCQNQDIHDERFRDYSFFADIYIPDSMESFLKKQEQPEEFFNSFISNRLSKNISKIDNLESILTFHNSVLIFIDLHKDIAYADLNYDLAGVELSGNQRYPEVDKNKDQGGCLYKKDLTPNMPESNCRQCHWGVYWRRLK